jgi:hypothetical protein
MRHEIYTLSLWEVAHRWNGENPLQSTASNIPVDVQDTIRALCKSLVKCEISVANAKGRVLKNPSDFVDFENFIPSPGHRPLHPGEAMPPQVEEAEYAPLELVREPQIEIPPSELTEQQIWNQYIEQRKRWSRMHEEAVTGLEETYEKDRYDINKLKELHLTRSAISQFCQIHNIALPTFWFRDEVAKSEPVEQAIDEITAKEITGDEPADTELIDIAEYPGKLTQEKIDLFWSKLDQRQKSRLICREIAGKLWAETPFTIEELSKHRDMVKYGNALHYSGVHTLRNWIKDLDPRAETERIGRPRKL